MVTHTGVLASHAIGINSRAVTVLFVLASPGHLHNNNIIILNKIIRDLLVCCGFLPMHFGLILIIEKFY